MKTISFITTLIFSIIYIETSAQVIPTSKTDMESLQDYFYKDDLLIKNIHYFISCKIIETQGIIEYRFELEKDTISICFNITDIKSGEKSIAILKAELLSAIKKLSQENLNHIFKRDSARLNQILDNVSKKKNKLTSEERLFLEDLIENGYQAYGPEPKIIGEYLDSLKSKLDSIDSVNDSKWIDTLRIININEAKEIPNQVNALATGVLSEIILKIKLGYDTDDAIGILYAYPKAKLNLNPKISKDSKLYDIYKDDSICIENIDIKFENEQIADIKIAGYLSKDNEGTSYTVLNEGCRMVFQNRVPIPYSTKADVSNDKTKSRFRKIRLYEVTNRNVFYVDFKDVIYNDYRLLNQTENYSPINQTITIKPNENGKYIKKETATKIIEAAIYSDLVGFNSSTPNGLIQTEISRRFYLNRRVSTISPTYFYCGLFNNIKPKVTFSKLESNNKVLELSIKQVDSDSVQLFANDIDIFKHTSWSTGGKLNLITFGLPGIHSMIYIDGGAFIFNVPMRLPPLDSTMSLPDLKIDENRLFNKDFLAFYPEINWTISPHCRFQIAYCIQYYWLRNFSKDFSLVSDEQEFLTGTSLGHDWANFISFKFLATLRLNNETNAQFFFRSYYNYLPGNRSQNYFQAQIGYTFNIFEKKNESPPYNLFEGL